MRFIGHEQGSPAWLAWRSGGIGGSDAAAILGLSPFTNAAKLFDEKAGRALPEASSFAMRRGNRLEPIARREYEFRFGETMAPACGEHDDLEWMRASLDGFSLDGSKILEIKWPNWECHQQALAGEVPPYYLAQVQHQLYVSGAELAHYWSCSENKKFAEKDLYALVVVRPDPDFIGNLLYEEMLFWERLQEVRNAA